MPTDGLPVGQVNRDSLGFAYIDIGVNLNPMKAGLTAAVGYLQYFMVKAQTEMDTAMRNIWTIVDTSYNEIMRYEDKVFKLSQMIPRSAKDLAEGLYWIISATIPAAEAMDVLEASAKSATAGLSTTYAAADVLTDIINAYGYKASDATAISDILFRTVERGKVTYDGLAGSLGAVVGTAAIGNVAFEELAAAVATMTQIGLSADESTTALNRFLLTIVKSSGQAQTEAAKLGLEWNASALEAKGLVGMVQALDEATGGNLETMARIVPEIRALKSVLALARDGAAAYTKEVENMYNAQGALERAFLKQKDSVANSLTFMKNAFYEFSTDMGKAFEPAIRGVYDFGTSLFKWLGDLPPATQKVIAATMLLSTTFAALQGPIKKAIASMQAFNLAAMGPGGWIAILGTIAAAIATIITYHEEWDTRAVNTLNKNNELSKSLLAMSQSSGETAKNLGELIKKYEELLPQAADNEEAASKLNDAIGKIGEIVPDAITQWDKWGNAIVINIDKAKTGYEDMLMLEIKYADAAAQIAREQLALIKSTNAGVDAELNDLNAKWSKYESSLRIRSRYEADAYTQEYQQIGKDIMYGDLQGKTLLDAIAKYMGSKEIASKALKEIYGAEAEEMAALTVSGTAFINFLAKVQNATKGYEKDADRRLELYEIKKSINELEYKFKSTSIAAEGLRKALEGTGENVKENVNTPVSAAIDKLAKLKKAIDAIFEPFTYQDKTIAGLEYAEKQLEAMLAKYPTSEQDAAGKYHDERLLIKQALYRASKELETLVSTEAAKQLAARLDAAKVSSARLVESAKEYADIISGIDVSTLDAPALEMLMQSIATEREKWGDLWTEGVPGAADALTKKYTEAAIALAEIRKSVKAELENTEAIDAAADYEIKKAQEVATERTLLDQEEYDAEIENIKLKEEYASNMRNKASLADKEATDDASDYALAAIEKEKQARLTAIQEEQDADVENIKFKEELASNARSARLAADKEVVDSALDYELAATEKDRAAELAAIQEEQDAEIENIKLKEELASNARSARLAADKEVTDSALDYSLAAIEKEKQARLKALDEEHEADLEEIAVRESISHAGLAADKEATDAALDYSLEATEKEKAAKLAASDEEYDADIANIYLKEQIASSMRTKSLLEHKDVIDIANAYEIEKEIEKQKVLKEIADAETEADLDEIAYRAGISRSYQAADTEVQQDAADYMKKAAEDAAAKIEDSWDEFADMEIAENYLMEQRAKDIRADLEAIWDEYAQMEREEIAYKSKISKELRELEEDRIKAAKEAATAFQTMVNGLISVLDKAFKVEGGYDNAGDALKEIVGYFSDFSKSYWKSVFTTARVKDTSLDTALSMVGEELALKVKDTGDMFVEALSDVGNKLKEMGGSLSDIGDKLIKASDGLGKIFGGIGGLIGDPIVQLFFSVAGFLFSAVEWLNAQVDKFKTKRLYFDTEAGTMVYETPEGRWEWDYKSRSWKQVPKKDKEKDKRAAFQISEISGPMRDTIVAALAPLNTLNSLPTYTNQIVSAIYEVRDLLSGAFTSGALAAGAIQQTFNIQSVNIFAYDEATFSSILADLDKQAQLAALGVGG